jgi:hypothetical protein
MKKKLEPHEIIMNKLEKLILFGCPLLGPNQNHEKRIKTFFEREIYELKDLESLLLSYSGGDKSFENDLKDSGRSGSGHVYDTYIYDNIAIIFDYYVKNNDKSCESMCKFVDEATERLSKYHKGMGTLSMDQERLICTLLSSILKYVEMTSFERLDVVMRLLRIIGYSHRKQQEYHEVISNQLCNIFPGVITKKQREKIIDSNYLHFYKNKQKFQVS